MKRVDISIIICTYNRTSFVKSCLRSFIFKGSCQYEIIVVDNYGDKDLNEYCKANKVSYIYEPNEGLSFARNKGANNSKGDWLLYLDDDVIAEENFFLQLETTIKNFNFDCFTGHTKAWHLEDPPRWLPENFGTKNTIAKEIQILGNDYLIGCVFCIKASALKAVGGFPVNLGMKGSLVGYGEETYIGDKLSEKGFLLGVNPFLIVSHAVLPHKYKLSWHLHSAIAFGHASRSLFGQDQLTETRFKKLALFIKQIILCPWRWITEKEFFIENYIIELLSPLLYIYGSYKKAIS